jgi:hypothetical protein
MVSSPCSGIDPVECIETAIARGLNGICITEHDKIEGSLVVKDIARGYKEIVALSGIEVQSREGHLLVYGYDRDISGVPPAEEVISIVGAAGGIVIPAHPWRSPFGWYSGSIDRPLEDTEFAALFKVIELYSGSSSPKQNREAEAYCEKTGAAGIGGSDAHAINEIGCCVTEFDDKIENEEALIRALRSGRFKALMNDSYYKIWGE